MLTVRVTKRSGCLAFIRELCGRSFGLKFTMSGQTPRASKLMLEAKTVKPINSVVIR